MPAESEKAKDCAKKSLCCCRFKIIGSQTAGQGVFLGRWVSVIVHIVWLNLLFLQTHMRSPWIPLQRSMEYWQDLGTTELLWPQCYRFLQANACGVVGQRNQKADCCRFLVSELISCHSAVFHTEHNTNICFKEKSFLCRVWLSVTSGLEGHLFFRYKCSQNYWICWSFLVLH